MRPLKWHWFGNSVSDSHANFRSSWWWVMVSWTFLKHPLWVSYRVCLPGSDPEERSSSVFLMGGIRRLVFTDHLEKTALMMHSGEMFFMPPSWHCSEFTDILTLVFLPLCVEASGQSILPQLYSEICFRPPKETLFFLSLSLSQEVIKHCSPKTQQYWLPTCARFHFTIIKQTINPRWGKYFFHPQRYLGRMCVFELVWCCSVSLPLVFPSCAFS